LLKAEDRDHKIEQRGGRTIRSKTSLPAGQAPKSQGAEEEALKKKATLRRQSAKIRKTGRCNPFVGAADPSLEMRVHFAPI
jgi:hypothetical protein